MKERIKHIIKFLKKRLHPRGVPFYVLLATVFALGVIFSSNLFASYQLRADLPTDFIEARRGASDVSKRIVELTSSVNDRIKKIDLIDVAKQSKDARDEINVTKQENGWAYAHAVELSTDLQAMTESLAGIPSALVQSQAYDAIAIELTLVSEFIVYTQNLNKFLESLDRAYAEGLTKEAEDAIKKELQKVNESTKTINKLNKEFIAKMKIFDKSL